MKRRKFLLVLFSALLLLLTACAVTEEVVEDPNYYRVTFYSDHTGSKAMTWKRLAEGSTIRLVPERDWILGWTDRDGNFVEPEGMTVTKNMVFYAHTVPDLVDTHVEYMGKIASVWFRPDTAVRREEAAQILYEILAWPVEEPAKTIVLTVDSGEQILVEGDSETQSSEPVYIPTNYEPAFSDLDEDCPYYAAVKTVAAWHLMSGYPDGTFRPDQAITRAEFIAMLRPFYAETGTDGTAPYDDVPSSHWAAQAIADASASGVLEGFEDGCFYPEKTLTRAEAVRIVNRLLGYQTDEQALDSTTPENLYVDVSRNHWAYYDILDATYSNKLLPYIRGEVEGVSPGFILIDTGLYHVSEDLTLDFYEAGFHVIDGQLHYCSKDGYAINRYSKGCQEINGAMYYALGDDQGFLTDGKAGYLYFDTSGRYTSGNDVIDEYVDEILYDILRNDDLSQSEKLYKAYCAIRDGGYYYMARPTGWQRGSTYWAEECAEVMYKTKVGSCFYWAASFLYLARRLGYQAYPVCGGVNTTNNLHAWVMIDWPDGESYIFDVELEWAYRLGYYGGVIRNLNLFKQPSGAPRMLYIFPGETYYNVEEENNEEDVIEDPEATPTPDGEPLEPNTTPAPNATPVPSTTPDPNATPIPDAPTPTPGADTTPEPVPTPVQSSAPDATTPPAETAAPTATPVPTPVPTEPPAATETPIEPEPEPEPDPAPAPEPEPDPAPAPEESTDDLSLAA